MEIPDVEEIQRTKEIIEKLDIRTARYLTLIFKYTAVSMLAIIFENNVELCYKENKTNQL